MPVAEVVWPALGSLSVTGGSESWALIVGDCHCKQTKCSPVLSYSLFWTREDSDMCVVECWQRLWRDRKGCRLRLLLDLGDGNQLAAFPSLKPHSRAVSSMAWRVVKTRHVSVSQDSAGRMNRSSPAIRSNRSLQYPS